MIVILFDQSTESRYLQCFNGLGDLFNSDSLWPFTEVKPTASLRIGILPLFEKWKHALDAVVLYDCLDNSLSIDEQIALSPYEAEELYFVSVNVIPNESFLEKLISLSKGQYLKSGNDLLALRADFDEPSKVRVAHIPFDETLIRVRFIEDLYLHVGPEIIRDFEILTKHFSGALYSESNTVIGDQLYIGNFVEMECVTLNTKTGPIYIEEGAVVMEGANLRGPLYIGKHAVVKMGTTIYGNVSIGECAVVGGEIANSSIGDFSAKGHYGYLGCSVIGDWCNLGAGTTNSNLKNNLSPVELYDYLSKGLRDTGLMKCGLYMGDFSRSGIQSAFNTGTVIGTGCMLALTDFYPKFVPSFTWLYGDIKEAYQLQKFISDLEVVFLSKNKRLDKRLIERIIEINQSTFKN
ncbi:putative sugar nucleotidyl transferase [Sphingobacterium kitahiroshimense]|uniref:Sugar nucleotidyl transferase n=1 Tax=Sphingobacterium kitahiroshimense TaxID=470446 RepID=A0ABV0BME8_9SPHI|nr:UDP-N-acetylglucosamine diphosphorylase/glucosamine-1-phosphate N-acetyltransferase [Sphingobacterium sp. JUb56]